MARITLERMHEDLESGYMTQHPEPSGLDEDTDRASDFVGEDTAINGRDADSLRFTSRAHVAFSERDRGSGAAEIQYYVEENAEKDDFVLYRSDTPEFAEPPSEGTGGLVLCEELLSVNFTYYDANGEAHDNWNSTTEAFKDRIPKMVSISLAFENKRYPEAPYKFLTTVTLPMGGEMVGEGV